MRENIREYVAKNNLLLFPLEYYLSTLLEETQLKNYLCIRGINISKIRKMFPANSAN
jgi:hypothetical protein